MLDLPQDFSDVKAAWGRFLTGLDQWDWFVTLTFRDPPENCRGWNRAGFATAKRAWREFCDLVGSDRWVRVFELQRRGVPHVHALVAGVGGLRRDEVWGECFRRWGISRILPYDRRRGAGWYLAKYVVKEIVDVEFGAGLRRPASAARERAGRAEARWEAIKLDALEVPQ